MNWRHSVPICLLLLAGCGGAEGRDKGEPKVKPAFPNAGVYEASPQQELVDQSFSDIPIETPFEEVRSRLTMIPVGECEEWSECEWRDAGGVRHYAFDGNVVYKSVRANEFDGRPIPALRIGVARRRDEVLAAAQRFLPEDDFECTEWAENGTESCQAMLYPGWVTINFDASGTLTDVQLDGYHFT